MSNHYTDADVQTAALAACSCQAAPADLHDPEQRIDCAWTRDCVSAALDAVAPAIAARALREFGAAFETFDSDYDNAFVAAAADERADEIEGKS